MAKVKFTVGDKVHEGEAVTFETLGDVWSHIRLEDGTVLKLKVVVSDVVRLPGKDPMTGFPQYLVRSSNVVAVVPTTPKGEQN